MWPRLLIVILLLSAGAMLCGCAAVAGSKGLNEPSHAADYPAAVKSLNDAVAMISRLDYAPAMQTLSPIIRPLEQAGDTAHAAEAVFWLGYCYEKTVQADQARTAYQRVIDRYPQTPSAQQARARMEMLTGTAP